MATDSDVLQLWRACYAGNTEMVQQLLDQDVDYTIRDRNGETVLHMAARSDNADVLNLLLDHLDPDVSNHNDQTPLHLAASKGHVKVVKVLLLADCDIDSKTKFSEMTALHLACQHNKPPVVSALLEGGAVCNLPDAIGKVPEFYTSEPEIHTLLAHHYKICQHFEDTHKTKESATQPKKAKRIEDDEKDKAARNNHKYSVNVNRSKMLWNKIVHNDKKIKINHGLGFSEEHKKRMTMNVFDRLMGSKK